MRRVGSSRSMPAVRAARAWRSDNKSDEAQEGGWAEEALERAKKFSGGRMLPKECKKAMKKALKTVRKQGGLMAVLDDWSRAPGGFDRRGFRRHRGDISLATLLLAAIGVGLEAQDTWFAAEKTPGDSLALSEYHWASFSTALGLADDTARAAALKEAVEGLMEAAKTGQVQLTSYQHDLPHLVKLIKFLIRCIKKNKPDEDIILNLRHFCKLGEDHNDHWPDKDGSPAPATKTKILFHLLSCLFFTRDEAPDVLDLAPVALGTYPGRKLEWEFHQILSLVGGLTLNIRVSDGVVANDAFRKKISEIFEKFVKAMETSALADDGLQIKHLGPLWGGPARPTRETPVPPSKHWVHVGAAGGKKLAQIVSRFMDDDPDLSAKDSRNAERALLGRSKGGKMADHQAGGAAGLGKSKPRTEKREAAWRNNGLKMKGKKRERPQVKHWDLPVSGKGDYIDLAEKALQLLRPGTGWPEVAEKFIDMLADRFENLDFDPFRPVNREKIYRNKENSKFLRIIQGLEERKKRANKKLKKMKLKG